MNILKRQLALLLVLAMTLTMLPMPTHADEVTDPESPSAIVEETTEHAVVSSEEDSTNTANSPVENAEPDTTAKENTVPAAETPVDTAVDSNTTATEELIADVSEDTPASDPVEKPEAATDADDTAEDAEVEENTESAPTVESEEDSTAADNIESNIPEASETDTQEGTDQVEPETDVLVSATFSRSVANAVTDECEHLETEVAWDTKDQVINCKPISDTQHQISGYQYRYCTSCYERVDESFAVTEVGNHELDANGRCGMCGYNSNSGSGSGSGSDPNPDCDHVNTAIGWDPDQLGPWYAELNDTQHKVTGFRYTYCIDCHERIRDEYGGNNNFYSEEVENHILNASGECTLCGYGVEPPCNHLKDLDSAEESYTDDPWYEQFDKNTHYIYRTIYYYCLYCGELMEETGYSIRNEPHTPEKGVCIYCNLYVGEDYCPHPTKEYVWDNSYPFTYEQYSANAHKKGGYQYRYCTSCSNRVGESYQTWDYEEHSLDDSGKCSLCGYQTIEDIGCIHENTEVYYYHYTPVRYEQCSVELHYIYRTGTIFCLDCRTDIGSAGEQSFMEEHTLTDGQCVYCGYGLGDDYCKHPASDVMWSDAPMTYTSLNEEQHQVEGCQYHYCTSCYKRISSDFEIVEYENHTFDSAGDCTLCDYRVGCAHSETRMMLYDTLYESLNKDSHEVTRLYSKVCANPDCGKVLVSVETSYTETDIEDHDFTENTCLLCNYTVADQLGATVTAFGQTANKGERISASVSVVGGTGGYQYSWKVLKDGSIKAGSPITTDTSYDYLANEEGSYVFQVTVTDSGGNTVTAQSDAITVSHGCQYETFINTVLVNQSLTHHTVETTTYEECTICHEKRNEVTDVQWVEHTPIDAESYGHEAAHPHKKYFICECGAHPYLDGEYHTANGEVQDESVCCICHDHKYGAEEETDEGTRQKTCANCGIITVTHTHDYKLVETTKLVSQSETHHTVETTTYEECTSCHEKRNEATNKEWVEHTPMNKDAYGYEASHDNYHQKYFICECGAHPYIDGEYETANGKVQEKSVCCICNGHKYGEAQEAADGTWKKTCVNCGWSERVDAPVLPEEPTEPEQPTEPEVPTEPDEPEEPTEPVVPEEEEKHVHRVSTTGKAASGHPHQYDILCVCGEVMDTDTMFVLDCCACIEHHIWGNEVMLPDGTFAHGCLSCGISEEISPSQQTQDLYNVIQMISYRHNAVKKYTLLDSDAGTIWKAIAEKATDKLTDGGFVVTNETLNTFSENSSITGAVKAVYGELTRETWDEQQTDLWETLLLRMLTEYYEDNADSAQEYKKDTNTWLGRLKKVSDKAGDILSDDGTYKELEKSISYVDEFITGLEMQVTVLYNEGKNTDALAVQEELQYFKDKKKAYEDEIASAKATGADFKKSAQGIGLLMDCISVIAEGTSSAQAVAERNDAFAEMLIHSDQCIAVLENVYASAVSVGNYNLADAADKIKEELKEEKEKATNQFLTETGAFFKGAAVEIGKKGLSKGLNWIIEESAKKGEAALGTVVKDAGSILKVLEMSAKGLRSILDWGGAYDAAQKLMTINQMDASMNIIQVLKNNESPYMIELWGLLQTEGCEHAQAFLNAWEDGTGLNSTDLGIDNGGLFGKSDLPRVLKDLGIERNYYITALRLPLEKTK